MRAKAVSGVHLVYVMNAYSAPGGQVTVPTRPSQLTWVVSLLVSCCHPHHRRHLLLLLGPKADTRFTVPRRVEG